MTPIKAGDLISREAVVELLGEWVLPNTVTPYGAGYNAAMNDAIQAIRKRDVVPAADAAPTRHGRWIGYDCTHYAGMDESGEPIFKPHKEYRCSLCGRFTVIHENYCPKCGAKMDEKDDSECRN